MMANHKGYSGGEGRISDQTPWLNEPRGWRGLGLCVFRLGGVTARWVVGIVGPVRVGSTRKTGLGMLRRRGK
jgi:hypothetical protein